MDIIFDTNILRGDPLLVSRNFERLKGYVFRTKSAIILPRIVLEELRAIYGRELVQRAAVARKAVRELNQLLPTPYSLPDEPVPEEQAETYIRYVREKLSFFYLIEPMYHDGFLEEVVHRAINRIKPASDNGQQFRDIILWLSIVDCLKHGEGMGDKVFISENIRDFANESHEDLHDQLKSDLAAQKLKLKYCRSLRDFIKTYVEPLEFITQEWLSRHIDWSPLQCRAFECANGIHCGYFFTYFERKYPTHVLENYYVSKAYFEQDISDFCVCEDQDSERLYTEIFLIGKAYVRFFITPDRSRWVYRWIRFGTPAYLTIANAEITQITAEFAEEETWLEFW